VALLVRHDTVTSDIASMAEVAGILTAAGSRTSHAAVVARQLGKVCLVGCQTLGIDLDRRVCRIGTEEIAEGEVISLDGNTGAIYRGSLPVVRHRPERELAIVAGWAERTTARRCAPGSNASG
jgi:pyruvate,orthophosphate dikinase